MKKNIALIIPALALASLTCSKDQPEGPFGLQNTYLNILLSANLDLNSPWTADQIALAGGISRCDTAYAVNVSGSSTSTDVQGNNSSAARYVYRTANGEQIDPENWEGVLYGPDGQPSLYRSFLSEDNFNAWHETKVPDCFSANR
ncbi:MAG TPA: hypothetical protein VJ417_13095 [Candidatus Glassbacteria bacterium]|nr:hypothetical protein [Candidatus Glassbacteria bacterium]